MKNRWPQSFLAALIACVLFLCIGFFAARVSRGSATRGYQYKCVSMISDQFRQNEVQVTLNQQAPEGWRLVSASTFIQTRPNGSGGSTPDVTTVLVFEKK
jgi:uncharacterized protein DUF4177